MKVYKTEKLLDSAAIYNNLGLISFDMNKLEESLKYHKKALEIRKQYLQENHPEMALSFHNLGSTYSNLGELDKATKYLTKSLEIRKNVLGDNNINTAYTYASLGNLYLDTNKTQDGLKYLLKSLEIRENILGLNHLNTIDTYYFISRAYSQLNNLKKSYDYANKGFENFLHNRDKIFVYLDDNQKKNYLSEADTKVGNFLNESMSYAVKLSKENNITAFNQVAISAIDKWLNYKGSIYDNENMIATLYNNTKDKVLKQEIEKLIDSKRQLAKIYQTLPKDDDYKSWQNKIKNIGNHSPHHLSQN